MQCVDLGGRRIIKKNFFKQKTAYEISECLVGSEMCIRDSTHMETEKCGIASVALGAGRESKEDDIDMSAGVVLVKKTGDKVTRGETIARLYTAKQSALPEAERLLLDAITFSDKQPAPEKLILARVSKDSVERF